MTKIEVQQRVLQNGKPLDLNKFAWDENTKTFSTTESGLVIDFSDINGCIFNTGSRCIFNTGSGCIFNTDSECTFDTSSGCTFKTGSYCIFNTGWDCTFDTDSDCIFKTGWDCIFNTDSGCTFDTGSDCTFNTGSRCVCVRRDIFEYFHIPSGIKIKLNGCGVLGYTELEELKEFEVKRVAKAKTQEEAEKLVMINQ